MISQTSSFKKSNNFLNLKIHLKKINDLFGLWKQFASSRLYIWVCFAFVSLKRGDNNSFIHIVECSSKNQIRYKGVHLWQLKRNIYLQKWDRIKPDKKM